MGLTSLLAPFYAAFFQDFAFNAVIVQPIFFYFIMIILFVMTVFPCISIT